MTRSLIGLLVLSNVLLFVSWRFAIVASDSQFGDLVTTTSSLDEDGNPTDIGDVYPQSIPGIARQGMQVYVSMGCISCHTQQVRLEGFGNDLARKWGKRPSVPRDYIRQSQPLLGRFRMGPDLANAGTRDELTQEALYLHLYSPQADSPDSICQPNPFLFEVREIEGDKTLGAIDLGNGNEILPGPRAMKLVAYLRSLRQDYDLPEMPMQVELPDDAGAPPTTPPPATAVSGKQENNENKK